MNRLTILLIVFGLAIQFGLAKGVRKAALGMGWTEGARIELGKR